MDIISVIGQLPFAKSVGRRKLSDIKYVAFHHDASLAPETYDAVDLYKHEAAYHIGKGWGHLGYSFRIARDGKCYQTVPLEEIGYHAGNLRFLKNSFGVCVDGSFDSQAPSEAQLATIRELMGHFALHSHDLPGVTRASMYAHREIRGVGIPFTRFFVPSFTYCPGPVITNIVKSYRLGKIV